MTFKHLTILLPTDLHARFKAACSAKGLKMTEVIKGWILAWLEGGLK